MSFMSASENKQLLQHIYSELSKGNSSPFLDALAEDVRWTIMGTSRWSKTYEGKQAVLTQLLGPLFAQFADQYTATAHRFIAEDDLVVVEVRGHVTTKSGKPYNNSYCYIFRLADGKIKEMTEYLDTQLAVSALGG
jgi:ketosteroid isomerase-like protein